MAISGPGATPLRTSLPDAWLVYCRYPDGTRLVFGVFGTERQAQLALIDYRKQGSQEGGRFETAKDSSELEVRVDQMYITEAFKVTLRDNWLKRNGQFIAPCMSDPREAFVFTFEEDSSEDLLRARSGGAAPHVKGEAYPCCKHCSHPLRFVGTLDFRGTPQRQQVPGDALTLRMCFQCDPQGSGAILSWLSHDQPLTSTQPENSDGKTLLGVAWPVTDYRWDWNSALWGRKDSTRGTLGLSPFTGITAFGSKIGGHICWLQGDQTPLCTCGSRMTFIGQFFGNPGLGTMFGDNGLAYLFHCSKKRCGDSKVVIQSF